MPVSPSKHVNATPWMDGYGYTHLPNGDTIHPGFSASGVYVVGDCAGRQHCSYDLRGNLTGFTAPDGTRWQTTTEVTAPPTYHYELNALGWTMTVAFFVLIAILLFVTRDSDTRAQHGDKGTLGPASGE